MTVSSAKVFTPTPKASGATFPLPLEHKKQTPSPAFKITRVYDSRADALEALLDVLHLLVVGETESALSLKHETTCFPGTPE